MGFAMSALPSSAAMVNAVRQTVLTSSGNLSNSLNAALIHEIGRVLLIISFALYRSCLSRFLVRDVVICDNIVSSDDEGFAVDPTGIKESLSRWRWLSGPVLGVTIKFIKQAGRC